MTKRAENARGKLGLVEFVATGVGGTIGGGIFSVMWLAGITGTPRHSLSR